MPYSDPSLKQWSLDFYKSRLPRTVVDVGAGSGTYAQLFRLHHSARWTAVEAMCSGIPVIATDTPGLRESTMGAAKLMNTRCPHAWNDALAEVLGDWDTWSGRSLERAARLDPDADLKRIRECILSVL